MSTSIADVPGLQEFLDSHIMPGALVSTGSNAATVQFSDPGYASTSFILVCAALVFIMTPGVGILYSGMSRSKNALSLIMLSFIAYSVVAIQWVVFGFSLTFSETGSPFIGNFDFAGLGNVGMQGLALTITTIPAIVFCLYQLQFATVTAAIIFGSVAERVRLLPSAVFIFFWTTLVYDPTAYWTWGARGWIKNMSCIGAEEPCLVGGIDFAGGGPVHIASGAAALAFCIFLGKRKRSGLAEFKSHNMTNVFLGTALLWFGWFGFNAGSALAANARAGMAGFVTTVSAASGALAWMFLESAQSSKLSGLALCSGAIAGLVGITPAAGFVSPWASIVIGIITSASCFFATKLKSTLGYDDSLDAFGLHGVGGFVGNILTALFASSEIALLDGAEFDGGAFINGNWIILGYNFAGSLAILSYSFVVTYILVFVIDKIPGLSFRVSDVEEDIGADLSEMGECAYNIVPSQDGISKSLLTVA